MTRPIPVSLSDVRQAAERLTGIVTRTPLVPMRSGGAPEHVHLKLETLQPTIGSFKIRGIFHAVASLSEDERARGLSTVSAGNTAQAVAWCGRHFGVPARSVMPESAPQAKIDAVRALGAEPVLLSTQEVFRFLREHSWDDEPYAFIHPWTDPHVHLGHGSMGLEILDQLPDVETVFIPVGGGGLLTGVAGALKAANPSVRIVAVEPEGCPAFCQSVRRGAPAQIQCNTICDGVAVPYITEELFPILKELTDDCVLIPEDFVRALVRDMALSDKIVAEPSGVLGPAAALMQPVSERGRSVALVTGGSIDAAKLAQILSA